MQKLDNQYFTYRASPANQDGNAQLRTIKGNTLVFNQLISEQFTHTFTGGVSNQNINIERIGNIVPGHKYLYAITQENSMTSNVRNTLQYLYSNGSNVTVNESNDPNHNLNSGRYGWIFTAPSDNVNNWISLYYWCHTPNVNVTIKDAILVDLTLMFGVGNEPTTVSDFTDLFQLPYYNYNVGSLLSFNGTGLKTENSTQSENNTLSLPISTYFPTGMKSVGTIYDELTPTKATTRIGMVDLGTLNYIRELYSGSQYRFKTQGINDLVKLSSQRNINVVCPKFIAAKDNSDGSMFIGGDGVFFYNNSYTDAATFKTAMSGVYLYYELATPVETEIDPVLFLIYESRVNGVEELLPANTGSPITTPLLADIWYSSGYATVVTHPEPISGGITSGDGYYLIGDTATINAIANEHYMFRSWQLDGEIVSTDSEYSFEVENE